MTQKDNWILGSKKTFFLDLIEREYLFEIIDADNEIIFDDMLCKRKLITYVIGTLLTTTIIVVIGFYLKSESLIVTPIAGAILSIPYFLISTERIMIFNGDLKKWKSYYVFGLNYETTIVR